MSSDPLKKSSVHFSRREFLGTMAATAAFTIVPRSVLGGVGYTAPSDMVNLAGIGVGAQGGGDIRNIATPDVPIQRRTTPGYTRFSQPYGGIQPPPRPRPTASAGVANSDSAVQLGAAASGQSFKHANIYALCDVDHDYAGHIMAGYPKAKKYVDFREMIDKEKEIDAVLIGTPDHTHAVIAAYAMNAGKHVFVEKPMAKTIYETRFLRDLAKKTGLVTQMGNQGHNNEGTMQTVEWIQGGVIGNVTEVHMWSNRPSWRQGYYDRPAGVAVPSNLNYDIWLGPAPEKPYHPDVVHFNWRGLWDYGTGAMGDMGAHTFDAPIWALNLGLPTKIQATSTPFNNDYLPQTESVTYEFPARGNMPPVKVTWSDGGVKPARPAALELDRQLREALYIGDKGMIMHGTHGAAPQLIPERPGFTEPAKTLPRPKSVYVDFIEAIKEGRKAANDFEIAAKLNEIMLLTNIAVVSQRLNITLEYDAANMRITNCPEANDYFHYEYRKGWSL
ncbi:Gfo/Idh/MocA family oxidoreductase [Parabacteroides sp. PF5-9]|uniref:Gfo/Idh/MocA family protein n=1 Tax=Parabacteroides sp. PF5-9 TaxID=1742404 RepID=UPI0024737657|nr:Gfo/Idh/MocA family oxidoreductase [Parabacteroides sp. PF5-9]MDH6358083.1 putative dehydrogenase [Parabacteroides sp. PF5-9]